MLVCTKCNGSLTLSDFNGLDFLGQIIIAIPVHNVIYFLINSQGNSRRLFICDLKYFSFQEMNFSLYRVTYEYHNRSLSQKAIGHWNVMNGLQIDELLQASQYYSFKNATLNILLAPVFS